MEIHGQEFFSNDGRWVWYDLQTPRSLVFWLAGYEIDTGKRISYHHERDEWSVHDNISPDGKLFAGDGGRKSPVSKTPITRAGTATEPERCGRLAQPAKPDRPHQSGGKLCFQWSAARRWGAGQRPLVVRPPLSSASTQNPGIHHVTPSTRVMA